MSFPGFFEWFEIERRGTKGKVLSKIKGRRSILFRTETKRKEEEKREMAVITNIHFMNKIITKIY